MARFYQPDLSTDLDSPFIRDGEDKLIRRSYWLDMDDRTLIMVMVNGIGANLANEEKRAHLIDLRREQGLYSGNPSAGEISTPTATVEFRATAP
jgi:hypothetical protein